MTNTEFVKSLRELADFFDANPDLRAPHTDTFNIMASSKEELAQFARAMTPCEKVFTDNYFILRKKFGNLILDAFDNRETVCERVVVGQEEVEEKVILQYETRKVMRDKVEWKCRPLLKLDDLPTQAIEGGQACLT